MYPRLQITENLFLSMYSTFYILAMILAVFIVFLEVRRHKDSLTAASNPLHAVLPGAFWTILSGIIGGKILYIIMNHRHDFWSHPFELLTRGGGSVYYGSEIFGVLGLILFLKFRRLPILITLDIAGLALAAAHGFGRIGCFMAGCCGGIPTDSPLGICFPDQPDIAVHPTQLYETVLLLAFTSIIWMTRKKIHVPGRIYSLYLITYGIVRFIVENYRETAYPIGFLQISPNQHIALVQCCIGVILFVITSRLAVKHSHAID